MAENSGAGEKGLLNRAKKRVNIAKYMVQQKVMKAERTTDNDFDQLVNVFTEQHNTANHLLKELKNYMGQVKVMSVASQSMYQAIAESYETSWKNADKFIPATEELIALWDDYLEKLRSDLQVPLSKYADQFRDMKKKIEKRGRKLTYYDGERHKMESLENAKKRDEMKITKAHEELNEAKSIYETIHNELCEELPALYQSRIPTLCSYFGSLFNSEAIFQSECAKIKTQLAELVDSETETVAQNPAVKTRLTEMVDNETETIGRSPAVKIPSNKTPPRPPVAKRCPEHREKQLKSETEDQSHDYLTLVEFGGNATANRIASESSEDEDKETDRKEAIKASPSHSTNSAKKTVSATSSSSSSGRMGCNKDLDAAGNPKPFHSSDSSIESNPKNALKMDGMMESPLTGSEASIGRKDSKTLIQEELLEKELIEKKADEAREALENGKESDDGAERKSSVNVGDRKSSSSVEETGVAAAAHGRSALTDDNYLYKVVAIHCYTAEDVDELSFEKGEVIGVLPFEELSEDQDEGWLFGVKSSTGEKGVFPINFTSRA